MLLVVGDKLLKGMTIGYLRDDPVVDAGHLSYLLRVAAEGGEFGQKVMPLSDFELKNFC